MRRRLRPLELLACAAMALAAFGTSGGAPTALVRAQEASALDAPLDGLDPLELARLVDRAGDPAVLAALSDEAAPVALRLRAIRAARFLDAPEAALAPLAELARGRDPVLAPAAALAAYRITSALSLSALEARETALASLEPAQRALSALAADETARGDLRRLAAFAVSALEALGGSRPDEAH